jgi:hypothetical protein
MLVLPSLPAVGGAAQFELPFARYPRGEYHLEVKATSGGATVAQLLPVRLIGYRSRLHEASGASLTRPADGAHVAICGKWCRRRGPSSGRYRRG